MSKIFTQETFKDILCYRTINNKILLDDVCMYVCMKDIKLVAGHEA